MLRPLSVRLRQPSRARADQTFERQQLDADDFLVIADVPRTSADPLDAVLDSVAADASSCSFLRFYGFKRSHGVVLLDQACPRRQPRVIPGGTAHSRRPRLAAQIFQRSRNCAARTAARLETALGRCRWSRPRDARSNLEFRPELRRLAACSYSAHPPTGRRRRTGKPQSR